MFSSHRFHGIDIPVYGPEIAVAATKMDFKIAADDALSLGSRRFVRAVAIGGLLSQVRSLRTLLKHADREHDKLAKFCNASTVDPKWGLYDISGEDKQRRYRKYVPARWLGHLLPHNYILAAEVDAIRNPQRVDTLARNDQAFSHVHDGTSAYRLDPEPGDLVLTDIWYDQFLVSHPEAEEKPRKQSGPVYADIDIIGVARSSLQ